MRRAKNGGARELTRFFIHLYKTRPDASGRQAGRTALLPAAADDYVVLAAIRESIASFKERRWAGF